MHQLWHILCFGRLPANYKMLDSIAGAMNVWENKSLYKNQSS
jgi:hypothetical protein